MSQEAIFAYLNLGRDKLLSQESLHRDFSDKALKLSGFSGLAVGFGLTILKIGNSYNHVESCLFMGQGLMFIVIVGITMTIVRASNWHTSPNMKDVAAAFPDYTPEKIIEAIGDKYSETIALNKETLKQKATLLNFASWAILAQVLLLASMTVYSVL